MHIWAYKKNDLLIARPTFEPNHVTELRKCFSKSCIKLYLDNISIHTALANGFRITIQHCR